LRHVARLTHVEGVSSLSNPWCAPSPNHSAVGVASDGGGASCPDLHRCHISLAGVHRSRAQVPYPLMGRCCTGSPAATSGNLLRTRRFHLLKRKFRGLLRAKSNIGTDHCETNAPIVGAGGRNRTDTPFGNGILSAARLPVPPRPRSLKPRRRTTVGVNL
jgi:hypothetical protein